MFYWIFEYVWMFFRLSALFHRCIKHIFTNAHNIKGFVCPALSTSRAILIHAPNARRTPGLALFATALGISNHAPLARTTANRLMINFHALLYASSINFFAFLKSSVVLIVNCKSPVP